MSEIIYDSTRSELENFLFKLERLEEQGISVGQMPDAVFKRLIEIIDRDDERKLGKLREELKTLCPTE
jgi:hypothetical protein